MYCYTVKRIVLPDVFRVLLEKKKEGAIFYMMASLPKMSVSKIMPMMAI